MIEYKVKESAKDPIDSIIVKIGDEIEFTLGNIETDTAYLKKTEKELVAQIGVESASKANIERTHPHVASMTQEDLTAAYLYRQATGVLNVANEKLVEIRKQLTDYDAEKAEIEKQTGLKLTVIEAQVQAPSQSPVENTNG